MGQRSTTEPHGPGFTSFPHVTALYSFWKEATQDPPTLPFRLVLRLWVYETFILTMLWTGLALDWRSCGYCCPWGTKVAGRAIAEGQFLSLVARGLSLRHFLSSVTLAHQCSFPLHPR